MVCVCFVLRDAKALQEKTAKKAERAAGANNFDGGSKNK